MTVLQIRVVAVEIRSSCIPLNSLKDWLTVWMWEMKEREEPRMTASLLARAMGRMQLSAAQMGK